MVIIETVRLFLNILASRRYRLLMIGLLSAIVGILLVASFQFVNDHRWYWTFAPFLCLVALLASTFGGLLIGHTLSRTQSTHLGMAIIGAFLCFVWVATGILALIMGALGMYELPSVAGHVGWDTYSGNFFFSGSHIRFLQIAAGTGFLGGVTFGLGLVWKRGSSVTTVSN